MNNGGLHELKIGKLMTNIIDPYSFYTQRVQHIQQLLGQAINSDGHENGQKGKWCRSSPGEGRHKIDRFR